jgi:uncharacterized membrane protein
MSRVAKSTTITSDPARVIDYIADVANHPAFLGPLKSVGKVTGDSKTPGTAWDWTFIMAGVEFTGRAETVAYEKGKKFSFKTTTGIKSTFVYSCELDRGGTKVSIDVTYEVPQSLAAKVQTSVVEKWNDAEGARAVENLKAILDQ